MSIPNFLRTNDRLAPPIVTASQKRNVILGRGPTECQGAQTRYSGPTDMSNFLLGRRALCGSVSEIANGGTTVEGATVVTGIGFGR